MRNVLDSVQLVNKFGKVFSLISRKVYQHLLDKAQGPTSYAGPVVTENRKSTAAFCIDNLTGNFYLGLGLT